MPQEKLNLSSPIAENDPKTFFNVLKAPVCYWLPQKGIDFKNWLQSWNQYQMPIAPAFTMQGKFALVNQFTQEGISIVDANFTVIEHAEALKLGMDIFQHTFGKLPQIHRLSSSMNGTEFSVDLIHPACKYVLNRHGVYSTFSEARIGYDTPFLRDTSENIRMNRRDEPVFNKEISDEYFPFVRVSNYLKKNRSFTIEMGYYRYKCSNGMLMGKRTRYTFRSSYANTSLLRIHEGAFHYFRNIKQRLIKPLETMWNLLQTPLAYDQLHLPAVQMFYDDLKREPYEKRLAAINYMMHLRSRYVAEIGLNFNAAMNIATDLSHHIYGDTFALNRSQSITGAWMSYFKSKNFNPTRFIQEAEANLERLQQKENAIKLTAVLEDDEMDEDPIF